MQEANVPPVAGADSAPSRLELLEQALANLRQELRSQASAAEQEQAQLEEALRRLLDDHQQIEAALKDMERQSLTATREAEARGQELREREYELVQLRNQMAERERELEALERRLKSGGVLLQGATTGNQMPAQRWLVQLLSLALVVVLGALAGVWVTRQSPPSPPRSSPGLER